MQPARTRPRLLAAILTATEFAGLLAWARLPGRPVSPTPRQAEQPPRDGARSWPMFGGGPGRNLVNLLERGLPVTWNVEPSKRKNVKWVADLGSHTYSGVVVSGGKVFIGTNNERPRDPNV